MKKSLDQEQGIVEFMKMMVEIPSVKALFYQQNYYIHRLKNLSHQELTLFIDPPS